MECL
jgi:adenylate kinase